MLSFSRRFQICLIAVFLALNVSSIFGRDATKPNIIFILSDDLGYGDLGCYGQDKIQTPHLDKLASDGIRFTQFYSGSTVCAPSRAALLTGYHSGHGQVRGNGNPPLQSQPTTLGNLMKKAGYSTSIIGKWGMGGIGSSGSPRAQGFDEFKGFVGHVAAHNQYPDYLNDGDKRWDLPEGTYANDVFTTEAIDFVRRHKEAPFFLYLAYTIPHSKMEVPSQGIYATKNWPEKERNKAAMISRMDAGIGLLLAELRDMKLDQNTIIFFASDNGPHTAGGIDSKFFNSNGPLRGIKRDLYEGGIRVPMIACWPGHIPSGGVSDQLWAMWDVLPTVLDLAGAPDAGQRDGISIKTTLLENASVDHGPLYWEFYERGFQQAVRKNEWKLVKTTTGSLELYNLESDIGETRNLARRRPEIVMELMPLLTSMRTDSDHWKLSEIDKKQKIKQNRQNKRNKRKH